MAGSNQGGLRRGQALCSVFRWYKGLRWQNGPPQTEAASFVPDEFSLRAEIIERRTRNDALAGARVASAGGAGFWSAVARRRFLFFVSALAFQTVAVAGTERKKPNQSGVEPPHSKESYRPMDHGKGNPANSGRFGCPQKEFGRNRVPMEGRTIYNAVSGKLGTIT